MWKIHFKDFSVSLASVFNGFVEHACSPEIAFSRIPEHWNTCCNHWYNRMPWMWTKIYVMSLVYVRQTWKPAPCLHFRQDMGRLCQSFALALWNHRFEMEKNESEAIGALLLLFLNDTASHPSLRWLFTQSSSEVVHNNRFHSWTRLERPQPRSNKNESKVCPFLKYMTHLNTRCLHDPRLLGMW